MRCLSVEPSKALLLMRSLALPLWINLQQAFFCTSFAQRSGSSYSQKLYLVRTQIVLIRKGEAIRMIKRFSGWMNKLSEWPIFNIAQSRMDWWCSSHKILTARILYSISQKKKKVTPVLLIFNCHKCQLCDHTQLGLLESANAILRYVRSSLTWNLVFSNRRPN